MVPSIPLQERRSTTLCLARRSVSHTISLYRHVNQFTQMIIQFQLKALRIILDEVRKSLQASRTEILTRQHSKATVVSIAVGDTVFKAAPERQVKLTPNE